MLQKLFNPLLIVLIITLSTASGCRARNVLPDGAVATSKGERQCIRSGWQKLSVNTNTLNRSLLYKGPAGRWQKGVIIVLHGGGGEASHFCAGGRLVQPQIHFTEQAIVRGFAVIALDSTEDKVTDAKARACGKRFDFSVLNRPNLDLPFIARVLGKTIPALRPRNSSTAIFMVGLSTGGYMTTRAATYFDDQVTAFAPVSAGDPYGTDTICDTSLSHRKTAKGILVDRETRKEITNKNACLASHYPNESAWSSKMPDKKPAFKQFQHEGDGIVDITCMKKAGKMLVNMGYRDSGAFVIPSKGKKSAFKHLWLEAYNKNILDFFESMSAREY